MFRVVNCCLFDLNSITLDQSDLNIVFLQSGILHRSHVFRQEDRARHTEFIKSKCDGETMITLSGTADKLREAWEAVRWNLLLALAITYLLMAALFESWLYPFVIIFSVPLGAVGGVLGLFVLNLFVFQALDVLTMLGFVILIGTVVNNAILIVHQSLN